MRFELLARDGAARRGRITFRARRRSTRRRSCRSARTARVKAMTPEELEGLGAQIILGNTFHLLLRPGIDVIRAHGGLHAFMHWQRPILTDSGGFQVWSLQTLRKITERGVEFRSPVNGDLVDLTPERSIEMQDALGADIVMVFDECTAYPAEHAAARESMQLLAALGEAQPRRVRRREGAARTATRRCSASCRAACTTTCARESLAGLQEIGFAGLRGRRARGRRAGGGAARRARGARARTCRADRPRYLMGVGTPADLVKAVARGIDMFDCVIPTRHARNGQLFTSEGTLNIRNSRFQADTGPIDPALRAATRAATTRASYLRHLQQCNEILGRAARDDPQSALLPDAHGADARRDRGRALRARSRPRDSCSLIRRPNRRLCHNAAPAFWPTDPDPTIWIDMDSLLELLHRDAHAQAAAAGRQRERDQHACCCRSCSSSCSISC